MIVRASSLGKIMATDAKDKITDKQLVTLNGLLEKVKLTEAQAKKRDELVAKRDAPPALSVGAKTYIREKAFEDKYGIVNNIENKYLDKGILCENEAIQLAGTVLGWEDFEVDCDYVENDFICGTPDVLGSDWLADIKCAWDIKTFFKHQFETHIVNSLYYHQLQAYMFLTGRKVAYLVYCLINTPQHLFEKELENVKWRVRDNTDKIDLDSETEDAIYEELFNKHHFDFIDDSKRVKSFKVEYEGDAKIKEKVGLATEYYNEIINEL